MDLVEECQYTVEVSAKMIHQENMSNNVYPLIPHFYSSKTGVCRGIPSFLIFAPKHKLYPQSMFGAKIRKQSADFLIFFLFFFF